MILLSNKDALEKLLKFKEQSRMTGKELAEHFDVSPQMISAIMRGKRNVTRTMAAQLADFDKKIDYIPVHGKSLNDISMSFDIPDINQPCFAFVSIQNTDFCKVGDLLICSKEIQNSSRVVVFTDYPSIELSELPTHGKADGLGFGFHRVCVIANV